MSSEEIREFDADRDADHETYKITQRCFNTAFAQWKSGVGTDNKFIELAVDSNSERLKKHLVDAKIVRNLILLEVKQRKAWLEKYVNNQHQGVWSHILDRQECLKKIEGDISHCEKELLLDEEDARAKAVRTARRRAREDECDTKIRKSALDAHEIFAEEEYISDEPDNDKGYHSDQQGPIIDASSNLGQATEMFNRALAEEHKGIKRGNFPDISTLFQMALNIAFEYRQEGKLENAQKMCKVITSNSDDYTQVLPSKAIQELAGVYSDQIRIGTPNSRSAKRRVGRLVRLVRTGYRMDTGGMFIDLARALLWLQDDENAVIAYSYSCHPYTCFSRSEACGHKVCRRCARVSLCDFCERHELSWDTDNPLRRNIVCNGHDYVDISGAIVDLETRLGNVQRAAWLSRLIKKYQA